MHPKLCTGSRRSSLYVALSVQNSSTINEVPYLMQAERIARLPIVQLLTQAIAMYITEQSTLSLNLNAYVFCMEDDRFVQDSSLTSDPDTSDLINICSAMLSN